MIEKELFSHLSNDTDLRFLIDERIYPQVAPQGVETPFVVYTVISDRDVLCKAGDIHKTYIRLQVDIYADSYTHAKDVKTKVKGALYTGFKPRDLSSRDGFEQRTGLYRQILDFKLQRMNDGN